MTEYSEQESHPDRKILDSDVVQFLRDAGGSDHVDELALIELNLLEVGGGEVGRAHDLILELLCWKSMSLNSLIPIEIITHQAATKAQLVQLGFVLSPVLRAVVCHVKHTFAELTESEGMNRFTFSVPQLSTLGMRMTC